MHTSGSSILPTTGNIVNASNIEYKGGSQWLKHVMTTKHNWIALQLI